jgi:hypothetical protein
MSSGQMLVRENVVRVNVTPGKYLRANVFRENVIEPWLDPVSGLIHEFFLREKEVEGSDLTSYKPSVEQEAKHV